MSRTVATGRQHEIVEVPPTHCGKGHRLGPRQVLVGYGPHPGGVGRARYWTCRECGHVTWDEAAR